VKTVKAGKIREQAAAELDKRAGEIREELFKLRFQHATGQLENPVRLRTLRRELARVLTVRQEAGSRSAKPAERQGRVVEEQARRLTSGAGEDAGRPGRRHADGQDPRS